MAGLTEGKNSRPIRNIQNETTTQTEEYPLHNVNSPAATKPLMVDIIINDQPVFMELDTGSAVTLFSEHTFRSKWPDTPLQISSVKLCMYLLKWVSRSPWTN